MGKPNIPTSAGSKLIRDFLEGLMVANKRLRYDPNPMIKKPGQRTRMKDDVVYTSGKPDAVNSKGQPIKYGYTTDSSGRVTSAHARPLELPVDNVRGPHYKNTPGKKPGDHAGHLFADMFGGSGQLDNLVSQLGDVNLKEMAALERDWADRLSAGQVIDVDIKVLYGPGDRPIGFKVYELVGGKRQLVGNFGN